MVVKLNITKGFIEIYLIYALNPGLNRISPLIILAKRSPNGYDLIIGDFNIYHLI